MLAITICNGDKFYRAVVSPTWALRHDNGALISCGLTVGQDGFTERHFVLAKRRFLFHEITHQEWKHSSCQSACVLQGAKECRW